MKDGAASIYNNMLICFFGNTVAPVSVCIYHLA